MSFQQAVVAIIETGETEVNVALPGVQGAAGASSFATISGTSYALSEADRSKILCFTSNSNVTVTVPTGLTPTFDCMFVQTGSGQVIASGASGVTINAALNATRTAYRYAVATLLPIGTDAYILSGEVTA
jgi:hypothetical protein